MDFFIYRKMQVHAIFLIKLYFKATTTQFLTLGNDVTPGKLKLKQGQ